MQLHNNDTRYDTIHGKYDGTVEPDGDSLVIDGKKAGQHLSHGSQSIGLWAFHFRLGVGMFCTDRHSEAKTWPAFLHIQQVKARRKM